MLIAAGAVTFIYGICVMAVIGAGAWFNWSFPVFGAVMIAAGIVLGKRKKDPKARERRGKMHTVAAAALSAAILIFAAAELAILICPVFPAQPGADYVILLGTQIKEDGPSVEYRSRLLAARDYLTENPDSMLVATGGKGDNEHISEAQGAYEFLTALGISGDRILLEDRSTNTYENLENAYEIITGVEEDGDPGKVVIISSGFHLFRARFIARKVGFRDVSSKGSLGNIFLLPFFCVREFFALVKDFFCSLGK